jgi:hypothetical protein
VDVLRVRGRVGGGEQASIGIANEVCLLYMQRGADGFEVVNLGIHRLCGTRAQVLGGTSAALIVEDNLPMLRDTPRPDIILDHVHVGETGAAVDRDDRRGSGGFAVNKGGKVHIGCMNQASVGLQKLGVGCCRYEKENTAKECMHDMLSIVSGLTRLVDGYAGPANFRREQSRLRLSKSVCTETVINSIYVLCR